MSEQIGAVQLPIIVVGTPDTETPPVFRLSERTKLALDALNDGIASNSGGGGFENIFLLMGA